MLFALLPFPSGVRPCAMLLRNAEILPCVLWDEVARASLWCSVIPSCRQHYRWWSTNQVELGSILPYKDLVLILTASA